MNDIVTVEDRIASKIDTKIAGTLQVSDKVGGISFTNAGEVMEFAKMLSISQGAVPKHLRGNPGACLGIVMQAIEWRMSPFAVANKSYVVNDRLAFEAQLIHAVAIQRAPIEGRIRFEFSGEGATRKCTASAKLAGQLKNGKGELEDHWLSYTSPAIGEIKVKNSPLWVSDPDQQLTYYSVRALCRRHFPDVLMGIFAPDEFDGPARARDVTPKPTLGERLDALVIREPTPEINVPEVPEPPSREETDEAYQATGLGVWKEPVNSRDEINVPKVTPQSPDDKEPLLIASAMAQAAYGSKPFTKWLAKLSMPDYERIAKSLPELNKVAASADRRMQKEMAPVVPFHPQPGEGSEG